MPSIKKKIKIYCSSFLPSKNVAWFHFKKLLFGEYGEFDTIIKNYDKEDVTVLVIFFQDLFQLNETNPSKIDKKLKHLIKLIGKRLKSNEKPLILLNSFWHNENILRTINDINYSLNIKKKFLKGLEKNFSYKNFICADLDKEFAKEGYLKIFDNRNWYFAHCRLSALGIEILANTIKKIVKSKASTFKKVLVLDCDNTLWGGVIGEDGIQNIKLGQDGTGKAFKDFQKSVKTLQKKGIILAVNSKNNEEDVWEVFNKHPEMIIKKKDIVAHKINWQDKSKNLIELSNELDLGLDSFVFWDDNPIERDKVKRKLPDVQVVDVGENVSEWPEKLYLLDEFAKSEITKEDLKKTSQYKLRAKFIQKKDSSDNEENYLRSIKLEPKIHFLDKFNISRAEQLCNKTNQFNLRSIRYKSNEILKLNKDKKNIIFLISLKDIYGDHGLVGLIIIKKINNEIAFLDNFAMSCRILGRNLEGWVLKKSLDECKKKGFKYLVSEYLPTIKNKMVKDFTKKNNFLQIENNKIFFKTFLKNKKNITYAIVKQTKIPNLNAYK
jgi:FkbH-like protein